MQFFVGIEFRPPSFLYDIGVTTLLLFSRRRERKCKCIFSPLSLEVSNHNFAKEGEVPRKKNVFLTLPLDGNLTSNVSKKSGYKCIKKRATLKAFQNLPFLGFWVRRTQNQLVQRGKKILFLFNASTLPPPIPPKRNERMSHPFFSSSAQFRQAGDPN